MSRSIIFKNNDKVVRNNKEISEYVLNVGVVMKFIFFKLGFEDVKNLRLVSYSLYNSMYNHILDRFVYILHNNNIEDCCAKFYRIVYFENHKIFKMHPLSRDVDRISFNRPTSLKNISCIEDLHRLSIDEISFTNKFNGKVDLFSNIKTIFFGSDFNQNVDNLPDTVKEINFGARFDQKVDNLPSSVTSLSFGSCFNQSVDHLPQSLENLSFGSYFNNEVNNLPPSLKSLSFNHSFNKDVNNLPAGITSICFYGNFNRPVNNLPPSLITLKFGWGFNQDVDQLPSFVKKIFFGLDFKKSIDKLPSSVTDVYMVCVGNPKNQSTSYSFKVHYNNF
jgi:hypothetical protein